MDQDNLHLVEEVRQLKDDIRQLKQVDVKLDSINDLMVQIRDSMISSHASLARHDLTLDEIKIGADFRKRESENSVREIKGQMDDMERDIRSKMSVFVDTIVERIDTFEKNHQNNVNKLSNTLKDDIGDLKRRVTLIEKWNGFHLTMLVVVSVVVLLLS